MIQVGKSDFPLGTNMTTACHYYLVKIFKNKANE